MEGLIPFVYKTVIRSRNGEALPSSLELLISNGSPSASSYMRLSSGDSGRHVISEFQLFPRSPRAIPAAIAAAGATQSLAAKPATA